MGGEELVQIDPPMFTCSQAGLPPGSFKGEVLSVAGPRLRSSARKAKGLAEGRAGHPTAALKGAGAERGGA